MEHYWLMYQCINLKKQKLGSDCAGAQADLLISLFTNVIILHVFSAQRDLKGLFLYSLFVYFVILSYMEFYC